MDNEWRNNHLPTDFFLKKYCLKNISCLTDLILLVNLHRSTRTNEYAGMQMLLTTNLKRDWSAQFNTDLQY